MNRCARRRVIGQLYRDLTRSGRRWSRCYKSDGVVPIDLRSNRRGELLNLTGVGRKRRVLVRKWGIARDIALSRRYFRCIFIGFGSDEKELTPQVGCELFQILS